MFKFNDFLARYFRFVCLFFLVTGRNMIKLKVSYFSSLKGLSVIAHHLIISKSEYRI